MNKAIQMLEEIGRVSSLKQYSNLNEMLIGLNVNMGELKIINESTQDLVCGLVPEDDEE